MKANKIRYENGVRALNELLAANLKIYRNGQKMKWCIDNRMGRCLTVTWNMADGTHTITEEQEDA